MANDNAYDYVRTVNSNMTNGYYSVTDTWVLSESPQKAIVDMEQYSSDLSARLNPSEGLLQKIFQEKFVVKEITDS